MTAHDDDLMATCHRNLVDAWRTMLHALGGAAVEEDDDLMLASTDLPIAFFNPTFVKRPCAEGEAGSVVQRIRDFYEPRHVPFLVWAGKTAQTPLVERAKEVGMALSDGPPAMVMEPIADAPEPPAELEIVLVDSPGLLGPTADVVAASFGLPLDVCHGFVNQALIDAPSIALFAGLVSGRPVSTSLLVTSDEVAGIYNVATADPNRGRGYGAALTWATVTEGARRGCRIATLQASPLGYPVYERMGFRHLGDYVHLVGGV